MPFVLPKYTWDKDRELCKQCKHYSEVSDRHTYYQDSVVVMLCAVSTFKGRRGIGTCIDNRTRGKCGPEGKLFVPINPTLRIET